MADRAVGHIQDGLAAAFPWLDAVYGIAERLVSDDGRRRYTPNVYAGGNEYTSILPDSGVGNYCYFWLADPQEVEQGRAGAQRRITSDLSLIVWFDIRDVPGAENRNRERVKADLLRVLNGGFPMPYGRFSVSRVYGLAENIFKEFTMDEVDNQFLMQPYCGFRFDGVLTVLEDCYE